MIHVISLWSRESGLRESVTMLVKIVFEIEFKIQDVTILLLRIQDGSSSPVGRGRVSLMIMSLFWTDRAMTIGRSRKHSFLQLKVLWWARSCVIIAVKKVGIEVRLINWLLVVESLKTNWHQEFHQEKYSLNSENQESWRRDVRRPWQKDEEKEFYGFQKVKTTKKHHVKRTFRLAGSLISLINQRRAFV